MCALPLFQHSPCAAPCWLIHSQIHMWGFVYTQAFKHVFTPRNIAARLQQSCRSSPAGLNSRFITLTVCMLLDACSPIMLIQIIYKMIFLPTTILPLVLAGRWSEFPLVRAALGNLIAQLLTWRLPGTHT